MDFTDEQILDMYDDFVLEMDDEPRFLEEANYAIADFEKELLKMLDGDKGKVNLLSDLAMKAVVEAERTGYLEGFRSCSKIKEESVSF